MQKNKNLKGGKTEMNMTIKIAIALLLMIVATFSIVHTAAAEDESKFFTISEGETKIIANNDIRVTVKDVATNSIKLSLEPQKQYTQNGNAVYELELTDFHSEETDAVYIYGLQVGSSSDFEARFYESAAALAESAAPVSSISLRAGETKTLYLNVKVSETGTHIFNVFAYSDLNIGEIPRPIKQYSSGTPGMLIYSVDELSQDGSETSFFSGDGFAIQQDDAAQGELVSLHILKNDDAITGKMKFGETSYKIDGTIAGSKIIGTFSLPEGTKKGEFDWEYKTYNNLILLTGTINFADEDVMYDLTAFAKREDIVFRKIYPSVSEINPVENIKLDEVIQIQQFDETTTASSPAQTADNSVYIRPIKVYRNKLFGVLTVPFAKNKVKFEIVEGGKITEKTMSENSNMEIEGYQISTGILDQSNIEIGIRSIEPAEQ